MIPHSSPDLGESEVAAAALCLRSQQVKGGPRLRELENRLAGDLGYAGAVATTSCTQAIHLTLRARFDGAPVSVGLPSYVCREVYDAVCLAGGHPQLLDIDPHHLSIDHQTPRLSELKAIIVPHMFGIRAPIEKFLAAGLFVIEDCAQRLAPLPVARQEPKPPVRVLSFEATKLLTCGEGGLLLSDDPALLEKARKLRDGPYELREPAVGTPLTDLQAAVLLVQWQRLPELLARRRQLVEYYLATLTKDFPEAIVPAMRAAGTYHFRFLLRVENPEAFLAATAKAGVTSRRPVAPHPLHRLFCIPGRFPVTDDVWSRMVSIPLYPRLSDADAGRVAQATAQALASTTAQSA